MKPSWKKQKLNVKAYSISLSGKKITRLSELTSELVHEFIEKIVVSAPEKIDGKRHQTVDIYYHGSGIIKMLSAEEMEEAYQQHISRQHKAKTA